MYKLATYHNDTQSDVNGSQVIQCFSAVLYGSSVIVQFSDIILDIVSDIFQIAFRYFRLIQFDNMFHLNVFCESQCELTTICLTSWLRSAQT